MVGYHKTADGKLCSENGFSVVDDLTACKEAAEEFGNQFQETKNYPDWPKGCYEAVEANLVFFNRHESGSAKSNAAQICKAGGKGMRSFLTSMNLLLFRYSVSDNSTFMYITCIFSICRQQYR